MSAAGGEENMMMIRASVVEESRQRMQASEIVARIRKLQWIGLDEDARRLLASLGDKPRGDVVLGGPHETD
jgi:hypothetical protein